MKFNESLAYNKKLRERIDNLRRERVVFDSIYKKLERELHDKKKVGDISNSSTGPFFVQGKMGIREGG